ncbi:MAG: HAMP domain-containing protein [Halopseudomonas sp.]
MAWVVVSLLSMVFLLLLLRHPDLLADARIRQVRNAGILLALIAVLSCAGLAWITISGIARAEQASSAMAAGDLSVAVDYRGQDELGQLARAFNKMRERFRTMVSELSSATGQLATAAGESSAVNVQASDGIRRQQSTTGTQVMGRCGF